MKHGAEPCAMPHASCVMRHAPCPMRHAACSMRHAPCAIRHAPCAMRHAPCPILSHCGRIGPDGCPIRSYKIRRLLPWRPHMIPLRSHRIALLPHGVQELPHTTPMQSHQIRWLCNRGVKGSHDGLMRFYKIRRLSHSAPPTSPLQCHRKRLLSHAIPLGPHTIRRFSSPIL